MVFGQLLGAGLSAPQAAACFATAPRPTRYTSFARSVVGSKQLAASLLALAVVGCMSHCGGIRLESSAMFRFHCAGFWPAISDETLGCAPAVWRRNLCYMAACGVADPKAVLRRCPHLLEFDQAAPDFLQRRLLL